MIWWLNLTVKTWLDLKWLEYKGRWLCTGSTNNAASVIKCLFFKGEPVIFLSMIEVSKELLFIT